MERRPWGLAIIGYSLVLYLAYFALSSISQAFHRIPELSSLAGTGLEKSPRQTWSEFGSDFRRHATEVITPEFLAALAQVESSGNPLARPSWTWRWTTDISRLYGPASSAVGLMQMTDGNFEQARRFSLKNGSASRLVASDSIEMTSGFLHFHVQRTLAAATASAARIRTRRMWLAT